MLDAPHSDDQARVAGDRGSPPGMPRWVKWSIVVVTVMIVAFVVSASLGVRHGPGMHTPGETPTSGAPGGHAPGGNHG